MDFTTAQRTLQSAIDQYPRLVALTFALNIQTRDSEMLQSRFQAEFSPLLDTLINDRIEAGKITPPTQLRFIRLHTQPALHGLLLLNQNSIWQTYKDGEISAAIAPIICCLSQAGELATKIQCVTLSSPSYIQLDRNDQEDFHHVYTLLKQRIYSLMPDY
ncbi:hypothetical protein [Pseudocitrobacter sp. MW920760]|uniref:hypothetical protein n=1 Tax=Pseudocitrobacter sp. MW920760 TaxID=2981140 RepID=UPI002E1887EE|nr:hypothetical protein [Pseudocitrobacter sp. MW920760]